MATRNTADEPNFDEIAQTYDLLRPVGDNWWQLFNTMACEGDLVRRTVLDVGCGTGRFAAVLANEGSEVWGVERSRGMLAEANERLAGRVVEARAEELPFRGDQFERVSMRRVVHLLERTRAFKESQRVLTRHGRLVVATLDPACFDTYWLNRFFPSLEAIDRTRYPGPEMLLFDLKAAGFAEVKLVQLNQKVSIEREVGLVRVRGRFMSTLLLLGEEEYQSGLDQMESTLPSKVSYEDSWMIAIAQLGAD